MASLAEWLKTLTPEQNQFVARLVASLPESEGGLGLPLQNTAHVAVLNPSKIRSKYAAFNHWRTNESNLLASHPVATALGSATLAKMLGAGQNIDLRQSINDKLSESADPLGLYSRYGMEAPYSYGDVAQQTLGATDLYAPIAAGEAIEAAKKGEWKKSGLSALGALPIIGAIKASHGSPHAFTKFDFSKIGTGEGAQAYGHGGYFAQGFDSPTAKEYQKQLAADVQLKGQPFYSGKSGKQLATTGNPELDDYLMANLGDVGAARANLLADLRDVRSGGGDVKDYQRTLADLRNIRGDVENTDLGHLYNVELKWPDAAREAADPFGQHHLLDWYAPFSQQPEGVKAILEPIIPRGEVNPHGLDMGGGTILDNRTRQADPNQYHPWVLKAGDSMFGLSQSDVDRMVGEMNDPTGENIYTRLVGEKGGQAQASKYLRSLGLPGIKYWDEGSRGAGEGTRNYVMFDDALANIVSRNGVSLSDLLKTSESPQNKLDAIIQNLESQGIKIDASYNPNKQQISLSRLVVPQEMRSQGVGTKAMQDLVNFADEQNALMQLSPSTDFGATSLNRLKDFYKRFGFVPNTGKYKDYSISESMYRPKK